MPISYPSSVESSGAGKGEVSAAMGIAPKPTESTELEKTSGAQGGTQKPGHAELKQENDAASGTGGHSLFQDKTPER